MFGKTFGKRLGRGLEEVWKKGLEKLLKSFGLCLEEVWRRFGRRLEEVWNPHKCSHQGGVIWVLFGGHVEVILDVNVGSCWCHFGVSDMVDPQVIHFLSFRRQLGAQVGIQVEPSWIQHRYLTSFKFRIRF